MAQLFSKDDANRIIRRYQELKSKVDSAEHMLAVYREDVISASNKMVTEGVMSVLKDIPVEEVNHHKQGIRVKALRDAGFHTVADIYAASSYQISSIYGISQDSAFLIKRNANEIAGNAKSGTRIRLSTDNKTPEATDLVSAIYRYKRIIPSITQCKQIVDADNDSISEALQSIVPRTRSFKWLFASKENKQAADKAYHYLKEKIDGEYGRALDSLLWDIDNCKMTSTSDAWKDFAADSIRYFNILEDINPGIMRTDEVYGGLPEDLAREIQEECFFPDGLLVELRHYQEWGVKYILHQERVLLGDEMGLGKTVQAIASMVSLRNTGATHFMVVCPASVLTNWCREIRDKSKLSVTKIHGGRRETELESWKNTGGVAVTTYETTAFLDLESQFHFTMLIVDEAHYIKNPEAHRTINVTNIGMHAERLLFMTGTALENKVDEMVALIQILQPRIAAQVSSIKYLSAAPQFREKVAPVYYRRKRDEVLEELPELIQVKEWCTLLPEEEQVYEEAVLGKRFADARRVSWSVGNLKKSSKAKRLMEIVEEAKSEDRKIIVFSFFLDTIGKITELMGDMAVSPINGSVSPQKRQKIIDEFEKAPGGTVLPAQIQSGGTGLNIQTASVVIICEPQFKPSIENQAISRAYRMGQTRNVLVYRLLCVDTVDERITSILEEKQQIFDAFADESVAAQKNMSMDNETFGNIINEEIERIKKKRGVRA